MSTWSDERRANNAAEAEQRRKDADAAASRRAAERAAEDKRRRDNTAADKATRRAEQQQARRDARDRRRERSQAWTKNTTPGVIYQRGTLALVTASALGSLPAQIAHFAGISLMLLPLPLAIEMAAWVMAAGVAYADEKKISPAVRWLLRFLCLSAAGFAAFINYQYGAQKAPAAAYGLAAVSLLGPLFFEVRQWVMTLAAASVSPQDKATARAAAEHAKKRAKDHPKVTLLAGRLMSAATHGTLSDEVAFAAAWEVHYGTRTPGMTPELYAQTARARAALEQAVAETGMGAEAAAVEVFLTETFGLGDGDDGPAGGTAPGAPDKGPRGSGGGNRQASPAGRPKRPTALVGKGKRASAATPERPVTDDELDKVRALAVALGGADKLSATNVRKAIGCRTDHAVRLRDAVQAETTN